MSSKLFSDKPLNSEDFMKLRGILNDVRTFFLTLQHYVWFPKFDNAAVYEEEPFSYVPIPPPDTWQGPQISY
jgi:hypothetical protein